MGSLGLKSNIENRTSNILMAAFLVSFSLGMSAGDTPAATATPPFVVDVGSLLI
jgi:hypothetical protein